MNSPCLFSVLTVAVFRDGNILNFYSRGKPLFSAASLNLPNPFGLLFVVTL